MAKGKTLADIVGSGIAETTTRRTWWHYLPEDARTELADVRRKFQAGEYGPKVRSLTVARMILPHCEERGWKVCDSKRMSEWLREKA